MNLLRNAPLFGYGAAIVTAEQDIEKHETSSVAQGTGPGAPQHTSWRGSHRFHPYESRDKKTSSSTDQTSQQQQPGRQFSRSRSRVRGRGRVLTLVSPSLTSISPINDNYCVGPTHIQVDPVQLDPKSAMVFSMAQDVDKLNLKTVVSKTVNPIVTQARQLDVSYHVVPHVHIVSLHGPPQKKGLSPDQTVSKIKHVKGVCCVNPCLSVPPVPNVPNAVVKQCVGEGYKGFGKFGRQWVQIPGWSLF